MSIILAIDPGTTESAYVAWNGREIIQCGKRPNEEVRQLVTANAGNHSDVQLVIEMVACYGMPVGEEVFETVVWIGRYMERWESISVLPAARITRIQVKSHICHSARANDSNIRQALIDRIGKQGTKKAPGPTYGVSGDIWAALALAITAHDRLTGFNK